MRSAKNIQGGGRKERDYNVVPTLEEGMYHARVVGFVDYGFQNQPKKYGKPPCYQGRVTYELVDEFMKNEDGSDNLEKPRWVSEDINIFNMKSERAISTLRLQAIDPDDVTGGTLGLCMGFPCQVDIKYGKAKKDDGHEWENINTVAKKPRKGEVAPLVNEAVVWDLEESDMKVWAGLPQFVKKKILKALDLKDYPLYAQLSAEELKLVGGEKPDAAPAAEKEPSRPPAAEKQEDDSDDRPY